MDAVFLVSRCVLGGGGVVDEAACLSRQIVVRSAIKNNMFLITRQLVKIQYSGEPP